MKCCFDMYYYEKIKTYITYYYNGYKIENKYSTLVGYV